MKEVPLRGKRRKGKICVVMEEDALLGSHRNLTDLLVQGSRELHSGEALGKHNGPMSVRRMSLGVGVRDCLNLLEVLSDDQPRQCIQGGD